MVSENGLVPDGLVSALSRYVDQLLRFIQGPTEFIAGLRTMPERVRAIAREHGTFWTASDGVMEMLRELQERAAQRGLEDETNLTRSMAFVLEQARELAENVDWLPPVRTSMDWSEGCSVQDVVESCDPSKIADVDEWDGTKEDLEKVEYDDASD